MNLVRPSRRCGFATCDARGTHRVVFVLLSADGVLPRELGDAALSKKSVLEGELRCGQHQERDAEVFFRKPGWHGVWEKLAAAFVRNAMAKHGEPIAPVRERTRVHYVELDAVVAEIPVLVETPVGLENAGKIKVIA